MPMIVLAVRIEVELIFKRTYKVFFSKPQHDKIATKLINDVITKLIDPNIYYSRFSFFESGREAINIKYEVSHTIFKFYIYLYRDQNASITVKISSSPEVLWFNSLFLTQVKAKSEPYLVLES